MADCSMHSVLARERTQEVVREYAKEAAAKAPDDDLATSLAAKGTRDEQQKSATFRLVHDWQSLFQLDRSSSDKYGRNVILRCIDSNDV